MSDPRKASDDLLIRLLREGLHDSEIAVRLGISTGQLRERKNDLRNRLGFERYQEILGGKKARRRLSTRAKLFLGGFGIAGGALAILLVIANIFAADPEEIAPSRVSLSGTPTAVPTKPAERVILDGHLFEDLGTFVTSADSAFSHVGLVSNRPALSVVELRAVSYIGGSEFVNWTLVASTRQDASLRGNVSNRQIDVTVYTERPQGRLRTLAEGVGPLLEVASERGYPLSPTIMVEASVGGAPVEARLTPEGRLLIALAPISSERVIDPFTGGELDVAGARQFGRIAFSVGVSHTNDCSPATPAPQRVSVHCRVFWTRSNRGYTVPADGLYYCAGQRALRYESGDIRLTFTLDGQPAVGFACGPTDVTAGMVIIPDGRWVIEAHSLETGLPLAVAISLNGQIYVGQVTSNAGCPCLARS